jgi:outer membrane lipoprotein-sorting protein
MTMSTQMAAALAAAFLTFSYVQSPAPAEILARTTSAYAELRSYADTATVVAEFGPPGAISKERHTFRTFFRAPRSFYFEFDKGAAAGGSRFVVWSDAEAFHTWWSDTGVHETYPRGTGANAFAMGAGPSSATLTLVAPLLFPQAGLASAVSEIDQATLTLAGDEVLGGRRCHKLAGMAKSVYAETGHVSNVRKMAVWIDAESALVRRIWSDTPDGSGSWTMRLTATIEPQVNPAIDDARFKFAAPAAAR